MIRLAWIAIAVALVHVTHALKFKLGTSAVKCFHDEFAYNMLINGEFESTSVRNGKLIFTIKDQSENIVFESKGEDFKEFQFTTTQGGVYEFCFEDNRRRSARQSRNKERLINFEVYGGSDAVDYTDLAKKEHLTFLETRLRQIEDEVDEVIKDYEYLKQRESSHRNTNESNNRRVTSFSALSILCLALSGAWQLYYLRNYFKVKKLL